MDFARSLLKSAKLSSEQCSRVELTFPAPPGSATRPPLALLTSELMSRGTPNTFSYSPAVKKRLKFDKLMSARATSSEWSWGKKAGQLLGSSRVADGPNIGSTASVLTELFMRSSAGRMQSYDIFGSKQP
jgi:hypothetical protein